MSIGDGFAGFLTSVGPRLDVQCFRFDIQLHSRHSNVTRYSLHETHILTSLIEIIVFELVQSTDIRTAVNLVPKTIITLKYLISTYRMFFENGAIQHDQECCPLWMSVPFKASQLVVLTST